SWQRRFFGSRWFHLDLPRHRVHFTPASLALALSQAGLAVRHQFASTSVLGLPASLQYVAIGRCIAASGPKLHASVAVCGSLFPLTWLVDHLGGELDTVHTVAEIA